MADQEKNSTPIADATGDLSVNDLPSQAEPQQVQSPEADAVKGGMGINRIVVTDGKTNA